MVILILVVQTFSDLVAARARSTLGNQKTSLVLDIMASVHKKGTTVSFPFEGMIVKDKRSWNSPGTVKTMKQARQKKSMMSLYGLVTKGPLHKTESELQFPPPKGSFISLRGKRQLEVYIRSPADTDFD
ncbi:unnamed protein product [Allacma fusca]|uniref:Uncharacterized protein n=1 Tax=Allacma fusca TaxID=39272 RepID=A0A8J2J9L4_9HEXA|nr:unnamed protein product [Allacma fusca]